MKNLKLLSFLILFISIGSSYAQELPTQDGDFVSGTRVKLTPPADFTPSKQFPGYELESSNSSILVTEIPGPFAEITAGFSMPSELMKRNMTVLEKREVNLNGHKGLFLKIEQKAYQTSFLKWLLVLGDEKETVLITATFPQKFETNLSEKLKASVLTTVWDRKKNVIPTEGLNFTIDEKGDLKLAQRISNLLAFTKNGIFPSKNEDDPILIVGQSISKTPIPANEEYAKARVLEISQMVNIKIEQTNKITIDGLNGYEIIANGLDTKSKNPMTVYQVMLFEEKSYFIIQGIISKKNRQPNLDIFKAMTETFKQK